MRDDAFDPGATPEPPAPRLGAKERALAAALARFDEKKSASEGDSSQGSRGGARPMLLTGADGGSPQHGARAMPAHVSPTVSSRPSIRTRTAIAASLATLVLAGGAALFSGLPGGGSLVSQPGEVADDAATDAGREQAPTAEVAAAPKPPVAPPSPVAPPPPVAPSLLLAPPPPRSMPSPSSFARSAHQSHAQSIVPSAPYAGSASPQLESLPRLQSDFGRDSFDGREVGRFVTAAEEPVSTFSIDVDTASYAFTRAALERNVLPPAEAVRTEELINYFPYAYPPPEPGEAFSLTTTLYPSPWAEGRQLLHVGIAAPAVSPSERPRANLVFLIDTSGSMHDENKLPLLRRAFAMLVDTLQEDDTVAIVAYAGSAGAVLEPTPVADSRAILAALERLEAGGSTAGGEGLRQAYALARASFDPDGVNRVMLATDGDFNVGFADVETLKGFVARERESGVFLSVLGFGRGNYNDALMQALAQTGNGQAVYIDTLHEARKVLVDEATTTLVPVARDVKIQVEFNPAAVAEYRLIGYETRLLAREDFNNDAIDAGDVGSGARVTALYEIVPVGGARTVDPLRYGAPAATDGVSDDGADELAFLRLRYKPLDDDASRLIERPVRRGDALATIADAPEDVRFATAVAAFGEILRGGRYTGATTLDDVHALASAARGTDEYGYRAEFLRLVRAARTASALERQPR